MITLNNINNITPDVNTHITIMYPYINTNITILMTFIQSRWNGIFFYHFGMWRETEPHHWMSVELNPITWWVLNWTPTPDECWTEPHYLMSVELNPIRWWVLNWTQTPDECWTEPHPVMSVYNHWTHNHMLAPAGHLSARWAQVSLSVFSVDSTDRSNYT